MTLPAVDQDIIDRLGTPELTDPYGEVLADGSVTFTERGRCLFAAALSQHGLLSVRVDQIHNRESLRTARLAVARARLNRTAIRAAQALKSGEVPVPSRALLQSVLQDPPHAWTETLVQRECCEAGGGNVLQVRFAKR